MKCLGRIVQFWCYPVKGMCGERVVENSLCWVGFVGDRRFVFVRVDDGTRFPWFIGRVHSELLRYVLQLERQDDPNGSKVRVTMPSGQTLAVDDSKLFEELARAYGGPLNFLHSGRGLYDAVQVSLIGLSTIEALCRNAGVEPESRRFRNNLVVELDPRESFAEEAWFGQML